MNIAIVARSQGEAQDLIKFYGINRRKDNVTVFTKSEQLQGLVFAGWLIITPTSLELVRDTQDIGRFFRYKMMEYLK